MSASNVELLREPLDHLSLDADLLLWRDLSDIYEKMVLRVCCIIFLESNVTCYGQNRKTINKIC